MRDDVERWSPLKAFFYSLRYRNPKSNRLVLDMAELTEKDFFLDVGCGPGAALEYAASSGANVFGIDPSPSMVARASTRVPSADVRLGSAETIPFPDKSFTVVVNISSFHHWVDREDGLKEISRILKPEGRLLVAEGVLTEGDDGHGLSRQEADILTVRLSELGYEDCSVETIRAGWRREYFVIRGSVPK
ncbi:MAG: class I SAM-dependent methyltransferase [Acidimicrobiia bacterium]|nr:class I SAM-dependent methyltransferase [Acidimicrobiia bacterium]